EHAAFHVDSRTGISGFEIDAAAFDLGREVQIGMDGARILELLDIEVIRRERNFVFRSCAEIYSPARGRACALPLRDFRIVGGNLIGEVRADDQVTDIPLRGTEPDDSQVGMPGKSCHRSSHALSAYC